MALVAMVLPPRFPSLTSHGKDQVSATSCKETERLSYSLGRDENPTLAILHTIT